VNNHQFHVSRAFFCCVSNLLFDLENSQQSFTFSVSDEVFNCFKSFIQIYDGLSFYGQKFQLSTIFQMAKIFHLKLLQDFILRNLSPSENLEDSIRFLSYHHSDANHQNFQNAISIIIENFHSLTSE
jgi:hypothetical protein